MDSAAAESRQPNLNHHVSIEKLRDASNYFSWKFTTKNILILEGLWNAVEGRETDGDRQNRALARICLSLNKDLYQYVRNCTTPADAWSKLKDAFEDKGLYRRVLLLRKLHRIQFSEHSSMASYIDSIITIVQQLEDIGRTIEDAEVAEILLSGLPAEYDTVVSSLSTAAVGQTVKSEVIKSRLLQEFSRKSSIESTAAFVTKKQVTCDFCKRQGHTKARCFKLKSKKRKSSNPNMDRTNMVAAFMARTPQENFYLDSGATNSMVNNKNLLSDTLPCQSNVIVADNNKISCEAIGKLQFSLKDKEEAINNCTACLEGKMSAAPYPKGQAKRADEALQLIHSDVLGPVQEPSWGGKRYLVCFTDDYTRKSFGFLMKEKSEMDLMEVTRSTSH
ncbi:uncharacterized protein LOC125228091 [Leguminivora glycinivorella]|uniref:uncharacterized protein LOC125228091 n=1 Tax=Leguminivora glycinivorella TaxID=1035111 RepID=UPI002010774D|nr:uncharacterized protein LOC125228091 [Leguminivora glycinivorella]